MQHPVFAPGRVALITGAASGIGLAAAERCAGFGMRLALVDLDEAALTAAAARLAGAGAEVFEAVADVGRREDVQRLHDAVLGRFGEVGLLMNNAGREGRGGTLFGDPRRWHEILETNLGGVVNGVQVFAPGMMAQATPGAIVNTGSKQGITTPPGDTAYNVSKSAIKVVTEALAHELRQQDSRVTAHLLIPGFVYTGFTRARGVTEKPPAAWTPSQVIDALLPAMAAGDFYILCPDNDVTRAMDEKRMRWAADDVIRNRPALSRWHPDHADAFAAFMRGETPEAS